ncbi:UTP--glucose-1-phosphate uridylyltransferase GalU [Emcibacter nanhaiensis]|uniref:UTP--glucose-1-phosphate uridylyltransferase n=1 Tax=Emcibacter nanhaiensis TaxID=1505037 RepID=A0A501PBR9_9PROT|nr:UTP--glucose-1-phosphate uridylyltransferase GalU [Emcibacter nanhaiensis]TPD57426.1 UTP--glucose-1-phosphate uridylyltransferase GalU [Emcibacter nanhaiensis]
MTTPVKKAVFPVAGLGTRFLPATKVMPKEMLTVVDKPLIQYAVEEAHAAGIEEIIFVTGRGKGLIEDHFDHSYELQDLLRQRGKDGALDALLDALPPEGNYSFTRQMAPLGLGHAIWCARNIVGDHPFAVILPDDLVQSKVPCLKQMVAAYQKTGANIVSVMEVPREQTSRYGILSPGEEMDNLVEIRGLVEKPHPDQAPSTLSIIGRYILMPEIFDYLSRMEKGAGGEIQVTDAMAKMLRPQNFYGLRFEGRRFDCGDKLGFLQANIAFGLEREGLRDGLTEFIKEKTL